MGNQHSEFLGLKFECGSWDIRPRIPCRECLDRPVGKTSYASRFPNRGEEQEVVAIIHGDDALKKLFSALIEHSFQVDLGIADPKLTDYLSDLLMRFVQVEAIFRIRDTQGRRLEEVAEMLMEAEEREANPRREIYRHIGDFTLFWSGLYPESLKRLQASDHQDHLLDYCEQGKRSYYIASTFDRDPYGEEAPVLRRLSEEFELCSVGLRRVRSEWEKLPYIERN